MKNTLLAIGLFSVCSFGAGVLTLPEAQALLLADNLDVAAASVQVQKAEARASYYPSLDAIASYSYITEKTRVQFAVGAPQTIGTHHNTQFGFDFSYPLFTGLSRRLSIPCNTPWRVRSCRAESGSLMRRSLPKRPMRNPSRPPSPALNGSSSESKSLPKAGRRPNSSAIT